MALEHNPSQKNKFGFNTKSTEFKSFDREAKNKLFSQTQKKTLLKKAFILAEVVFKKKY